MKRFVTALMLALCLSSIAFAQNQDVRREDRQADKGAQQHQKKPDDQPKKDDKGVDFLQTIVTIVNLLTVGHP